MNWRRWKIGAVVSLLLSLFVAGAALASGSTWLTFAAVFCSAAMTHFGSFIKDHPAEEITFDTDAPRGGTRPTTTGTTGTTGT